MGMFTAFDITASGLTAERYRMDTIAENIAKGGQYEGMTVHTRFPPDISHERGKTAYVIRERFVASVVLPDCRGPIMDTTAYSFATSASHFAIFL